MSQVWSCVECGEIMIKLGFRGLEAVLTIKPFPVRVADRFRGCDDHSRNTNFLALMAHRDERGDPPIWRSQATDMKEKPAKAARA